MVPIRLEFAIDVPGAVDEVWAAVSTGRGLGAWFLPTDVEERLGGTMVTHLAGVDVAARVTGWEPPHRFAYEEPGWAALVGHADADVTPLATEFVVEVRAGGSCAVCVVTEALGTGAPWEQEFVRRLAADWLPSFEHLRVYLAHFAGMRAATFTVVTPVATTPDDARAAMRHRLGVRERGQVVDLDGRHAVVEQVDPAPLVRLVEPVAGMLRFAAPTFGRTTTAQVSGFLFPRGVDAAAADAVAADERSAWADWLAALADSTGSSG